MSIIGGVKSEEVIERKLMWCKMPKTYLSKDKISKILAFRFYALSTFQHSNFMP